MVRSIEHGIEHGISSMGLRLFTAQDLLLQ